MIFDYAFFLHGSDRLIYSLETDQPYNFIVPVSTTSETTKKELFEYFYNSNHQFCLLLTLNNDEYKEKDVENVANYITSFFFLANYIKHNNRYLLLVNKCFDREQAMESYIKKLKSALQQQIVWDISIIAIDTKTLQEETGVFVSPQGFDCYLKSSGIDTRPESFITNAIQASDVDKKWIVEVKSQEDFSRIISSIQQFEKLFFSINPLLTRVIKTSTSLRKKCGALKLENELLKVKLENTAENLKMLRTTANAEINHLNSLRRMEGADPNQNVVVNELRQRNTELESAHVELKQWYSQQYDVLPLWYKRFGHVIKVITGKRSLKSLFK